MQVGPAAAAAAAWHQLPVRHISAGSVALLRPAVTLSQPELGSLHSAELSLLPAVKARLLPGDANITLVPDRGLVNLVYTVQTARGC
jgi:hypothetical protein